MKNNKSHIRVTLASPTKTENLGWQDNLSKRIKTLEYFISSKIKTINGLVTRKGGRGLIGQLLKFVRGVRPRASKSVVRQTAGFVFYISRMARHSGLKGVVLYLKACQVLLQQVVGGYRVIDLGELKVRPRRNKAGLPLIIPSGVRVRISRDRDITLIKLWMTLLGLYRILEFRGKLSLDTITDAGPNLESFLPEWESFLESHFVPNLRKKLDFPKLGVPKVFPILKSGPLTDSICGLSTGYVNSSGWSLIRAARVWLRSPDLIKALDQFLPQLGISAFKNRLELIAMASHDFLDRLLPEYNLPFPKGKAFLGKLGFKLEPAGKVRVFAMVDAWTQWLMSPLHEWIFSILRKIPQDGTFDQLAPILALQKKYSSNPKGLFASIDLSSATDRLPISLQVSLLKLILKDVVPDSAKFSQAWADLLVNRFYQVKVTDYLESQCEVPKLPEGVRYSVGQPMGALSSWAMLALTHHAMMQFSAFKAGHQDWYEDYGVLGDDGVLKGGNIVREYRSLLQIIGVKAGLAKSILARGKFVIEFAKKFFVDSTTANMLPIKECVATSSSTSLVLEFVRKYDLSINAILSFLGFGYKAKIKALNTPYFALGTRLRVLLVWLSHPSSPLGKPSYTEWLLQRSWKDLDLFLPVIEVTDQIIDKLTVLTEEKSKRVLSSYQLYVDSIKGLDKTLDKVYPVNIISMDSSSLDSSGSQSNLVPWKAILSPELHAEDVDYDHLSAWNTGGMSVHGYRYKKLADYRVGIDFDKIITHFYDEIHAVDSALAEEYATEGYPPYVEIERLITLYFKLDELLASIPEKFWVEERKPLRPFRDFLEIYNFWQDLSKPLWSAYYKGKIGKPISSKVSKPKPARGESEGKVTLSPPIKDRFGLIWWGNFGIGALISLFISGFYEPPIHITLCVPEVEILGQPSDPINYWAFGLMGLGLVIVLVSGGLSWYYSTIPIPREIPIVIEDPILRWTLGIPGPLTADQLDRLQSYLEAQALLENLALSPIGDLWRDPW